MTGLARKVLKITADMSPNVRWAKAQIAAGLEPTGEVLIPGVLTWEEYCERRKWPKTSQRISLDAEFPEDEGMLLFPSEWLKHSVELWKARQNESSPRKKVGKAMGCDPAEGGDNTSWAIVDDRGLLYLHSEKTPDTAMIPSLTYRLMQDWQVAPERVVFDRACGKPHADRLRAMGQAVQTVHFSEKVMLDLKRGLTLIEERREQREEKSIYSNRRAEMYHKLSSLCDPKFETEKGIRKATGGFSLPSKDEGPAYERLHKQLAPIPIAYDKFGEGTYRMPPKPEMIADLYNNEFSPDEADALVLAVYGLTHKPRTATAGAG